MKTFMARATFATRTGNMGSAEHQIRAKDFDDARQQAEKQICRYGRSKIDMTVYLMEDRT